MIDFNKIRHLKLLLSVVLLFSGYICHAQQIQGYQVDTTFRIDLNGFSNIYHGSIIDFVINDDGTIMAVGDLNPILSNPNLPKYCAKFHSNGQIDTSFHLPAMMYFDFGSPGRVVKFNQFYYIGNSFERPGIIKIDEVGKIDTTFDFGYHFTEYYTFEAGDMIIDSLGRVILAGSFEKKDELRYGLLRLKTDGRLDSTFHRPRSDFTIYRILPLPGKKYLACGDNCDTTCRRHGLWRIFEDGTLDTTFDTHCTFGYSWQLSVLPDGKYLTLSNLTIPGYSQPINLMRWNTDGSVDSTFNYYPYISSSKAIKSFFLHDSKIIVSGNFDTLYGQACHGLATLNYDGIIDTSLFSPNCGPDSAPFQWTPDIYRYKLTPNGEMLISGFFTWFSGFKTFGMVRLKPLYAGIDEKPLSDNKLFSISPNPCASQLNINFLKPEQGRIEIFDVTGRPKGSFLVPNQSLHYNININNYSPGVYLIHYTGIESFKTYTARFIVIK